MGTFKRAFEIAKFGHPKVGHSKSRHSNRTFKTRTFKILTFKIRTLKIRPFTIRTLDWPNAPHARHTCKLPGVRERSLGGRIVIQLCHVIEGLSVRFTHLFSAISAAAAAAACCCCNFLANSSRVLGDFLASF